MLNHANTTENTTLFGTSFTLGPDGNRLAALETNADGTQSQWVYHYDPLGRLVQEQFNHDTEEGENETFNDAGDRDITYEYDADSNRVWVHDLNQPAASRKYVYGQENDKKQQLQEIWAPGSGDHNNKLSYNLKLESYEWTSKGELRTKRHWENGEDAWQENYTWGVNSTLLQVTITGVASEQNGTVVQYAYDDRGTLVRRKVSKFGATISDEKYLVDYNNPTGYSQTVAVLTWKGKSPTGKDLYAVSQTNTFGDRIFSQTNFSGNASNTNYLIGDALGSVRAVTGKTGEPGNLVQQFAYTAFGSPMEGEGTAKATNYAFTGQLRDPETGLQYHRARWYDQTLGRWFASDPLFDFPSNLGNQYGYCAQSPLLFTDISGKNTYLNIAISVVIVALLAFTVTQGIESWFHGDGFWAGTGAALSGVFGPLVKLIQDNIWVILGVIDFGIAIFILAKIFSLTVIAIIAVAVMLLILIYSIFSDANTVTNNSRLINDEEYLLLEQDLQILRDQRVSSTFQNMRNLGRVKVYQSSGVFLGSAAMNNIQLPHTMFTPNAFTPSQRALIVVKEMVHATVHETATSPSDAAKKELEAFAVMFWFEENVVKESGFGINRYEEWGRYFIDPNREELENDPDIQPYMNGEFFSFVAYCEGHEARTRQIIDQLNAR